MNELFDKVEGRIADLMQDVNTTAANVTVLYEVQELVVSMRELYVSLLELNEQMREFDHAEFINRPEFQISSAVCPQTGDLVLSLGGKKVARFKQAKPGIPIEFSKCGEAGAFTPGKELPGDDSKRKSTERELARGLERYYYEAHRVWTKIKRLDCAKNIKFGGVGSVRNKLIEHPPSGEPYTFGWSDSGPIVKPATKGARRPLDAGLVPNTQEFLQEIVRCLGE